MKKIDICQCCQEYKPLFRDNICKECDEDINEVYETLEKERRFERAYYYVIKQNF